MAQCPSIDTRKPLILPATAAILLGISSSTLKRMRLRGEGPPIVRITTRTFRYRLSDIEIWLEGQAMLGAENREQTNE